MEFLKQLRQRLPSDYRLGITGLLDWSSRADSGQVNQLRGLVDELVVQTYQGRHTIENYSAYLPRVSKLNMPFKIGLIQGGNWDAPRYISEVHGFAAMWCSCKTHVARNRNAPKRSSESIASGLRLQVEKGR